MSAASRAVGVIGAGTMGAGIAQVAAAAGHPVLLFDTSADVVRSALEQMRDRLERSVAKGRRTQEAVDDLLSRIAPAAGLEDFSQVGLVIEAIIENLEIKQQVFGRLEQIVPPDAVLATNTSSISVTAIAARLERPERVVGMHFFNPAPVMPLVEIVVGADTSADVVDGAFATAAAWGKTPVTCTSTPGFIVNRVARPFYSESLQILDEGVADIATIDAIVIGSGGFRMGPFTLMDLVGLDVNLAVSTSVYAQTYHDPRFAPHVRQQAKVDAGHLGRKSGQGWYSYDEPQPAAAALPAGPAPAAVRVGVDRRLEPLVARLEAAGVAVDRTDMLGAIDVDGVEVRLTDGRPAGLLMHPDGAPDTITLDLVLDWANASAVALAAPERVPQDSVAKAAGLFQAAGLLVYRVEDSPGMVLARIVAQVISVAADAAAAGVATPDDIDTAMRLGTNYPGGPFEWADHIGAASVRALLDGMRATTGDGRFLTPRAVAEAAYSATPLRKASQRRV